jgi:hypothetical protein
VSFRSSVWVDKMHSSHQNEVAEVTSSGTAVLRSLFPSPDREARTRYSRWFQKPAFSGLLHLELSFYSDEAWFILIGYINGQSNRYWSTEDSYGHEVPLHHLKFGFGKDNVFPSTGLGGP